MVEVVGNTGLRRTRLRPPATSRHLLWDLSDRTRPRQLGRPLAGHTNFVQAVALSPPGAVLAAGGWDRTIRLWHVPDPTAGGR